MKIAHNIPTEELLEHTCGHTCKCKPMLRLLDPKTSNDREWVHHAFDQANALVRGHYTIVKSE